MLDSHPFPGQLLKLFRCNLPVCKLPEILLGNRKHGDLLCADHVIDLGQAPKQPTVHCFLDRTGIAEVKDGHHVMLLPDPVDSADSLLHLHRIPWKVKIDQQVGLLQV